MKKPLIIVAIFGSLVLSHAQIYEANLDGLQEVPPNLSTGYGFGEFSLSGTTFSVTSGSYQDLLGNSTAITLSDAGPAPNGPVVFLLTLSPGAPFGPFGGSGTLAAGQITD